MTSRFSIGVLMLSACVLISAGCQSRPSVGQAKDVREVAAIKGAMKPTREEIRDHLVTVANACWLNNKSPAFAGLALRTKGPHPKVPHGFHLTLGDGKNASRYVEIHIIPADAPDGGYIVYVDQNSKNKVIDEAIEKAIDRLEAKYDKSLFVERDQPLC